MFEIEGIWEKLDKAKQSGYSFSNYPRRLLKRIEATTFEKYKLNAILNQTFVNLGLIVSKRRSAS